MMWQPVSGCGDQCRDGADPHAARGMATLRMVTLAGVLLGGFLLVPLVRGPALRTLARTMLAVLGIRLVRQGPTLRAGSLLTANHVSWLDILVLLAVAPVRLVAKGEVGAWPGIGALAGLSGAIFIDRSRPKALPATVAEVAAALRAGRSVAAFPEGTTFCGANQGRFRPALFQAAIDAGAPVVPASIRYDSTAAAFIGDDTLWDSIRRVAALRSLTVTLVTAPALRPTADADRRTLARTAQSSLGPSGYRLAA
ncbi:1-acyl-sn-glycerol-3-phosphate acyltransferase [Actinoplanes sp. KI2]|uniref:lysophospholipid acyltransferase family protein n=1 Tax=Actinoplanes sp. KI2 TaxID=2983315 RepID=UPI0021D5C8A1|nr:lysophospholipid acyltransferase family protein [Actinoplanes sp. KI2]MCU7724508.1 1-acyl-sn-glycerol-3-phosphate acyltransferase [Actinoplanes sp. KI2]